MATATRIDGKALAETITADIAASVHALKVRPGLAVVLVGNNPASEVYVRNKGRIAEKCGFTSRQIDLPADADHETVRSTVQELNADPEIHGILVQLPLPPQIDADAIMNLIDPAKDVDGFHPVNVGRLGVGDLTNALIPCTPAGSVRLAKHHLSDDLSGMHAVVVGRSNIVGKPAAQLFLAENCTVSICHSRTRDLPALTRQADILVAAVGIPEMIQGDWIRPGATVIDVGINRAPAPEKGEGKTKLVGDVHYDSAAAVAGAITPVPGGVGPMTIAMLMHNTLTAAKRMTSNR